MIDQCDIDDLRRQSRWAKQQLRRVESNMYDHPNDPDRDSSFDDMSSDEIAEYEQWLRNMV